jgi:hypothetical protein
MAVSLLKTIPLPVVDQTRNNNVNNGNDAELWSASKVLLACGAEISWGSRNEDGRKIDLIMSYDHPWFEEERLVILIQVKSGPYYGEINNAGFILKSTAKVLAQRTSHSICIIWVDRVNNKTFWAFVHPNTLKTTQQYGKYHEVTPALRFDLARCAAKNLPYLSGGKGIILSSLNGDLKTQRAYALRKYRRHRGANVICPNLGKVEFTKIGWKHMFREGRSASRKSQSLRVLINIDKILSQLPSETYISKYESAIISASEYRSIEYVLTYDEVLLYDKANLTHIKTKVVIRLIEEIRWPRDWLNRSTLSQEVTRRLVLLSTYHK